MGTVGCWNHYQTNRCPMSRFLAVTLAAAVVGSLAMRASADETVRAHNRSSPDGTVTDNWSYKGTSIPTREKSGRTTTGMTQRRPITKGRAAATVAATIKQAPEMPTGPMQRPAFPPVVREIFNRWKQTELCDRLEASHWQLLDRRKNAVEVSSQDEPRKHTGSNCLVLQQALLHRAERLLAAAGVTLLENNIYGLALVVRGHYEATAVLGYVCDRLESLKDANIEFERFTYDIARAVLGAKHPQFANAPDPPHILTCIEKADRYLDTHLLKQKTGMLSDGYNWLCEAYPVVPGRPTYSIVASRRGWARGGCKPWRGREL